MLVDKAQSCSLVHEQSLVPNFKLRCLLLSVSQSLQFSGNVPYERMFYYATPMKFIKPFTLNFGTFNFIDTRTFTICISDYLLHCTWNCIQKI